MTHFKTLKDNSKAISLEIIAFPAVKNNQNENKIKQINAGFILYLFKFDHP